MNPAKEILFLFLIVLMAHGVKAQKLNSVGIRLIDPMGVTYKRYTTHKKAIEVGIGTIPDGWLDVYYRESFDHRDKYEDMMFRSSQRNSTIYLFGRLLMQNNIPVVDLKGTLEWYWGVGVVFKTAEVKYEYSTPAEPYEYFTDKRTDIDIGPDLIGGLEYTFEKVPVTLYTELSLFLEIADRTNIRALGGIGGRYRF